MLSLSFSVVSILFNNFRRLLKSVFNILKNLIKVESWEAKFCILFNLIILELNQINCTGEIGEKEHLIHRHRYVCLFFISRIKMVRNQDWSVIEMIEYLTSEQNKALFFFFPSLHTILCMSFKQSLV